MKYLSQTHERPCMIELTVRTTRPRKLRVKAYPVTKDKVPYPNTVYTNRYATIYGKEKFLVKLPKTSEWTVIEVFDETPSNDSKSSDKTFEVVSLKKKTLPTKLFMFDFTDPTVASFVTFAENFASKCGYMSEGIIYSPDSLFRIDYIDGLLKNTKGGIATTPARIGSDSAIVEASKERFKDYTTAGIFAILLHEFSHFYKNKKMRSEEEADYYSVNIALGKGYPEVELLITYGVIFNKADNPENRKRYERIKKYINDFPQTAEEQKSSWN